MAQLTGMPWLRNQMRKCGFNSLQDVSDACGINRGNIYRYFTLETRPSIDVVPVLCEALNCSPTTIMKALVAI